MKVLIVEDEKQLSDSICEYLRMEDFECERAADYQTARAKIKASDYDCIVLDVGLPGGSGLQLLEMLKMDGKGEGVLIISAHASLGDRVEGLKKGADDYLIKPFHMSELSARVEAIIRRRSFDGATILQHDVIFLNTQTKTVLVNQTPLDLTRKEYEMLLYFIVNKAKVISKSALAYHLWPVPGTGISSYDLIYTHIKNLRRKLTAAGSPDYIQSVYGMGYKLRVP